MEAGIWRMRKGTHRREDELREEALHSAAGTHEDDASVEQRRKSS